MQSLQTVASEALSPSSTTQYEPVSIEYLKAAKRLLGCYRTGEANDPEVYIAGIIRVLSGYPIDIVDRVVDPLTGLPGRSKWLPTPPELKAACDDLYGPVLRRQQFDERSRAQLAERAAANAVERPKRKLEDLHAEMTARGFPMGKHDAAPIEAEALCQKYGVTREQFDALPDLPSDHSVWGEFGSQVRNRE